MSMKFLKFVEETSKFYKNVFSNRQDKCGTVLCCMVSSDIYASTTTMKMSKAVADVSGAKLTVFPNVTSSKQHNKLVKSYLPDHVAKIKLQMLITLLRNPFRIFILAFSFSSGDKLHRFSYDNKVEIGKHIYDYILRKLYLATITKVSLKMKLLIIVELAYYISITREIDKVNPCWVILPDNTYRQGMIFEYLKFNNVPALVGLDLNDFTIHKYCKPQDFSFHCRSPSKKLCLAIKENDENLKLARKYFEERVSGEGQQHDVKRAFSKDKKRLSREQLIVNYELDPELPIILVAAHVFCDAPHAYPGALFQDYFHWFVETCECLTKNDRLNFIVKEHPSSDLYGEKGIVGEIAKRAGLRIKILSDDVQTSSLFELVDCLVTCGGTAGMEFAACGVPVIVASSPPYSHLPFVLRPATKKEYFVQLESSHTLNRLNQDKRDLALSALYAIHCIGSIDKQKLGLGGEKIYLGQLPNDGNFMSQVAKDYVCGEGYESLKSVMSALIAGEEKNVIDNEILS